MAKKKNKNTTPLVLEDLWNEMDYTNFKYKDEFLHLCDLLPNISEEKLDIIKVIDDKNYNRSGLVYVFVIEDKIFKIGQSISTISERVHSYNCGKVEYRTAGTNSTTNYFVLQSILKINKRVKVYAFFPETPTFTLFGEKYTDSYPPTKVAKNKILTDIVKEFGKKPIGCTQT